MHLSANVRLFLSIQYPVLTLGDGLGSRVVLHEGSSAHSRDYVVEECDGGEGGEGVRLRRLVFLSTQHLAQTKVYMVPGNVHTMYTCINFTVKLTINTGVVPRIWEELPQAQCKQLF